MIILEDCKLRVGVSVKEYKYGTLSGDHSDEFFTQPKICVTLNQDYDHYYALDVNATLTELYRWRDAEHPNYRIYVDWTLSMYPQV